MANRYGALTLQLKQLSNLADIGSAHTNVLSATGRQKLSESGNGSFVIPRDYSAISAIDSNIGQVAYVYLTDQVASGAAMDVATFIIKEVDRTTDPSGMTVTVKGDGLEDQLTYTDLDDNTIDNGAGGKDTSDIDSIMGYASSGWTYNINGGAGTGSSGGSYFTSRGNNVLQLLIAATKQNNGDTFRLNAYSPPSKVIRWNTTADSSGITLRMPSDPTIYDSNTTVGIILNMTEDSSFEDVVTRIRPYGAGLDNGRLDITDIDGTDTGGDPAGYTTTFASNLIVNTTLETSLGYSIKRDKDFSQNRAADITDATQLTTAAVALWNEGITYLAERDSTKKFYRLSCIVPADLRPGQTVSIVYTEYEGGISGGNAVWTVNDSFYIHEVTNRVSNSGDLAGVRVTDLVVSDTLAPKATDGRILATALQTIRETTRKSNSLSTPGAVPTSRTISTDLPLVGGGDLSANRTHAISGLSTYGGSPGDYMGMRNPANQLEWITPTAGAGISVGHSANTLTITNTGQTSQLDNLAFLTIGNTASLSAERALTAGDGLDLADGGANSTATLSVDVTDIIGVGLGEDASNNLILGTPSTLTVSTGNLVAGSSHTHAITTSSAVSTATATILATDSNGRLQVRGLGVGTAATTNNAVVVADDGWIGLGSSAARIVFDNQATDQIEFLSADVLIGSSTKDSNKDSVFQVLDGAALISQSGGSVGASLGLIAYNAPTGTPFAGVQCLTSNGTRTTPTATTSGQILGRFGGGGYGTSAFSDFMRGYVQAVATQNFTNSAQGTKLQWAVTADGATSSPVAMELASPGTLRLGLADASVGTLVLSGDTTSSNEGGEIQIELAADHDATYAYWRIDAFQDDLRFGPEGSTAIQITPGGTVDFSQSGSVLQMNGTQVLKERITGWTQSSGTGLRTGYTTGTATTLQVAQTLKALIDDLFTHGIIGT